MITFLLYVAIAVFEAYIIFCEYRIWMCFKRRSDARTSARRAAYRIKAYRDIDERRMLKMKRQELWRAYGKI